MEQEKVSENPIIDGIIWKQLLLFSAPILCSNLFQQLYNFVDAAIVGNVIGSKALAAVGSAGYIVNLLIGFFIGVSTGAGIIIAQLFGAKDELNVKHAVHTSISICLLSAVVFTAFGILASPMILKMMNTPDDVIGYSTVYLRIYFLSIAFVMLYNIGSGILRAVGDSRRPLYYLIVACLLNVVLDLLFVACWKMGVAGSAWATLISQAVASGLVIRQLMASDEIYRLSMKQLSIHPPMLHNIFRIGLPAGVQAAIENLVHIFMQAQINSFGSAAMAGIAAANKIDGFIFLPITAAGLALTTFVGQNIGAGRYDRAKKSMQICMAITILVAAVSGVIMYFFSQSFLRIFSQEQEVIRYGVLMVSYLAPFYFVSAYNEVISGMIRGSGSAIVPMVIGLGSYCVFRLVWIYTVLPFWHDIRVIVLCYPIAWVLTSLLITIYYKRGNWRNAAAAIKARL